jgi:hypothetical protein
MGTFVIVIIVLGVGALVYVFTERRRKRPRRDREAELRVVAERLGFAYEREGDPFRQEPFLEQDITRASQHLERAFYGFPHFLRGACAAGPVTVFDVWHGGGGSGGSSDASDPYKVTMAGFRLEGARLPPLRIYPEGRLDRAGDSLWKPVTDTVLQDWRDIDFDDHPAFSERYSLRSNDEVGTRALFTPALLEFWESLPEENRLSAAASGQSLVVYRDPDWKAGREGALRPDDYEPFLRGAEQIASAFRHASSA